MSNIHVTPLTTTIGARIDGVDLRNPLEETDALEIRAALAKYSVIAFSGQNITLDQQKTFARHFGVLEQVLSHRLVGNNDTATVLDNKLWSTAASEKLPGAFQLQDEFQGWHVDSSYCPQIPAATTLRAEVLPPVGGGTCWASMGAAFEALSGTMQQWLETLQAVHAPPPGQRAVLGVASLPENVQEMWEKELSARLHPVVTKHPVNGRKALFVNPAYTVKIDKLSNAESALLLRFLFNHCVRPDFTYRHRWNEGDILVWDQLASTHLAPSDYLPHERRVVRVTAGLATPTGVGQQPPAFAKSA